MYEITVPKLNSNDVSYVLTDWLFEDGDQVPSGASVVVVETSKAAQELAADGGGVLLWAIAASTTCRPGEVVGRLFADERERQRFLASQSSTEPRDNAVPEEPLVTEPARALAEELGISADELRSLGRSPITRADVERLAAARQPAPKPIVRHEPSRQQQAIAEVVALSHQTIPAAFAVVEVDVDATLTRLHDYGERHQISVGLPELLVSSVARLFEQFPLCFASMTAHGPAELAHAPRIGVTIDVGTGLYVPVVRTFDTLSGVAEQMMQFRVNALRSNFRSSDLCGANIAVSLPAEDVVLTQPFILPPNVCMLALGATQTGVRWAEHGELTPRRYVQIGLSYDHRLINGRDAAMFLTAVKRSLLAFDPSGDRSP